MRTTVARTRSRQPRLAEVLSVDEEVLESSKGWTCGDMIDHISIYCRRRMNKPAIDV